MANASNPESTQQLDLRGLSGSMIEMQILRLFNGQVGRLHLDCVFDDDPNEALRDLERHCSQWTFQRIEKAHWIIRNFPQGWDAAFRQLGLSPTIKVTPYGGAERRDRDRGRD
jgi:hypothetical protein